MSRISPPRRPTPPPTDDNTTLPTLARVAIVGRVNVGKSSLFNRLTGDRRALVSMEPGTTRDRQEGQVEWNKAQFILIDTGGVEDMRQHDDQAKRPVKKNSDKTLDELIGDQAKTAALSADLVVLVVSVVDGVMPQDIAWAEALRGKRPMMLVVNKVDNRTRENSLPDFYSLGIGEPIPVSAASGRLSGDLLDEIVKTLATIRLPKKRPSTIIKYDLSVALLGQPNAGKSSFLNALLGEERVIVSPTPRTTREPIDTLVEYGGKKILLIDTAGIRRRSQVTQGVEAQGVSASIKTIERAETVLLLIDVSRGPTLQDQRLANIAVEQGRGLIIVANKWDLIEEKTPKTLAKEELTLRRELPGLDYAPIIFVSAKTGQRVKQVLDDVIKIQQTRKLTLDEATLQGFLKHVVKQHQPSKGGGVRHPVIMSLKQTGIEPPQFTITTRGELHPSYLKFLENQFRLKFDFSGTPIQLVLKAMRQRILR